MKNQQIRIVAGAKAPTRKVKALPANWQAFKDVLAAHSWTIDGEWAGGQPFFMTVSEKEARAIKLICKENKVLIDISNEDLGFIINPR